VIGLISFRARLTLAYLLLLTLALSAFGLGVYAYVDRNLHQEFYGSVQRQGVQLSHVLTTYDTDADILRAVEAGAAGYLLKDCSQAELTSAIRAAARGETVLAPTVATGW